MSLPKMLREISTLKRESQYVRPNRTAGILTSVTTQGTFRRPIGLRSNVSSNTSNNSTPRWA